MVKDFELLREPYGISIEDTEGDSIHSEDDEYEDSFIDDSELPISPPSPIGKKKTKELRSKRLKKKFGVVFDQNDGLNANKDEAGNSHDCELKVNRKKFPNMDPLGDDDSKVWERENVECKDMMVVRDDVKTSDTVGEEGTHTTQITSDHFQTNVSTNVIVLSDKDHSQEEMMVIVDSLKNRGVVGDDETHSAENVCDHIQPNDYTNVCESDSESKKVNDIGKLMGSSAEAANLKSTIEVVIINQGLDISNKKDIPTHQDEAMIDADNITVRDTLPMDTQSKSKKRTLEKKETSKPKISKLEVESSSRTSICNMEQNEGKVAVYETHEEKLVIDKQDNVIEKRCEAQSLPNGLIIEELAKRDPHGKLALRGRKVRIHFTGMLKESGVVFDTSVGKNPCKFRLGDEEIMDGFNMGIDVLENKDLVQVYLQTHGSYEVELVGVQR
ncbi:UNVERIFIED_CONTAM: Peptidyl-prolyl cis-trans isomerase FKBP43 [Sesamum radiatum]|uniref:peptidylprolyl isomerase n=1 Tax=Sesamum radiatum TaxID=300843 RepID=A0AAW2S216_SESRA